MAHTLGQAGHAHAPHAAPPLAGRGLLRTLRSELGITALEERNCLEAISSAMDDSANIRTNQAISLRTRAFPRVTEIKAEWLELRPLLVEARLRYMPEQAEREAVLASILNHSASPCSAHNW